MVVAAPSRKPKAKTQILDCLTEVIEAQQGKNSVIDDPSIIADFRPRLDPDLVIRRAGRWSEYAIHAVSEISEIRLQTYFESYVGEGLKPIFLLGRCSVDENLVSRLIYLNARAYGDIAKVAHSVSFCIDGRIIFREHRIVKARVFSKIESTEISVEQLVQNFLTWNFREDQPKPRGGSRKRRAA